MLPVQYASTINIGVLDSQLWILLLMLQHSGMANTKIKYVFNKNNTSFCGVPPYSLLDRYQCFEEACRLLLRVVLKMQQADFPSNPISLRPEASFVTQRGALKFRNGNVTTSFSK